MLEKAIPYKVVKYLQKLSKEKVLGIKFQDENFIRYLLDRQVITLNGTHYRITQKFEDKYSSELNKIFTECNSFIGRYNLTYLENHYSITEFEALIKIDSEKQKIIEEEISFQNILTQYFGSSKHKTVQSNLSKAIKTILGIEFFPEENKDQQYISILYPKKETRFIILCENKNRLIIPRHEYIEFWYVGGKNTKQLQFIPKPIHPIFYLFDWDYDGLLIYIEIKQKHFSTLTAFLPKDPYSLMEKQENVKKHHSKWKDKRFINHLSEREKSIVESLFVRNSIIEEQSILLTKDNLLNNSIV